MRARQQISEFGAKVVKTMAVVKQHLPDVDQRISW